MAGVRGLECYYCQCPVLIYIRLKTGLSRGAVSGCPQYIVYDGSGSIPGLEYISLCGCSTLSIAEMLILDLPLASF